MSAYTLVRKPFLIGVPKYTILAPYNRNDIVGKKVVDDRIDIGEKVNRDIVRNFIGYQIKKLFTHTNHLRYS